MDSTHTRLPAQLHVHVEDVFEVLRASGVCRSRACVGPRSGVRVQTLDVCLSRVPERSVYGTRGTSTCEHVTALTLVAGRLAPE